MLSSTVKSQINSKLKNIYSKNFKNNDLKLFSDEIYELIKITNKKITLKTTNMNISLPKDDYYIFRYIKKNNSKKNNRKFYEELLKSLG